MATNTENTVLTVSDDLPIATVRPVHSGKVRSVYFLRPEDSQRLIEARAYPVAPDSQLAIMVISDRLSAFDCLWRGRTLAGVPGKGAALNAIAAHWFQRFSEEGLGANHLLEMPHPMLWVVRQARPIMIEAIARRYLTGSLWRAYACGERQVGGVELAEGMKQFDRLPELLFTPSTKGVVRGIPGLAEADDHPVAAATLREHWSAFGFRESADVDRCRDALKQGFTVIEEDLGRGGDLLVDTKFEFGIAPARDGGEELLYMDEVGTPDSSRIWRRSDWERGEPKEYSKEQFRAALLDWVPDPSLLLDSQQMEARAAFARQEAVPDSFFEALGETYRSQAAEITGKGISFTGNPREEMLALLDDFGFRI